MNTAAAKTRQSNQPAAPAAHYYDRSFWGRAEDRAEARQAKRRAEMPLVDARLDQLSDSFGDGYPL